MAVIESKPITVDSLIDEEESQFISRMPGSIARAEEARKVLAGGATSSWMIARPAAVWVSHGLGSRVWDVDGTEYVDLHGGYGVMVAGHANPAIVEAVQRRVTQGTHFAQPTDDSIVVAQELSR
ncbi:MAG TPA: aminotransferase class III-fold pyridoxal phosphate-dependent enzyme, partial [Ilumatobacteraceae bacterium]